MSRKLSFALLLAGLLVMPFLAACQSAQPAALTGARADKAHYVDDKGHFRADLYAADKPLR